MKKVIDFEDSYLSLGQGPQIVKGELQWCPKETLAIDRMVKIY